MTTTTNLIRLFQAPPQQLHLAPDGMWFRVGDGPMHRLNKHRSMRGILQALVLLARMDARATMSVAQAFEAGWPGETASPKSAATRVYTAIHKLRKMGLMDILVMRSGSYVLQADIHIVGEVAA